MYNDSDRIRQKRTDIMGGDHRNHRQRVKKEFLENGLDHFPSHKVLELLLFYSIPRRDTNELAHRLVRKFGSFSAVFDAPYELLLEVEGMGSEAATYLKVLSAFNKRYLVDACSTKNIIKTIADAKEYMRYRFLSDMVECVRMVCLSHSGRIIYSDTLAKGTLEKVEIVPGDVVKTCLRANAIRAIVAHNHPGGFCNPSRKDLQTTSILYGALEHVDIELFDHIIVASDGVYSMKENNMFPSPQR